MKKTAKILVVDDDPNLRKTLSDILKVKGYATAVAASGGEAVAAAQRENFGLALIDLMLPDISGLEVMARIKAISPLTEAIILTGHASMDTAIEATGKGAFSYLLKPYQMDELLLAIRHGIERQQAQEEILRLASFPRLHPSPVIELAPDGSVSYLNPAAEISFPELSATGGQHPLLKDSGELFEALRLGVHRGEAARETRVGDATYELHMHYIPGLNLIRIYVLDITQRKRAEEEIHLLATTDGLTGIANRREFSAILTKEIDRAKRYGSTIALAMYDLDWFKRINDTCGHDVGDDVLQSVTRLVKQNIRINDVVARWGGEEFMVLMLHSDMAAALGVAEKLRAEIAGHSFDKAGQVTASFGVTVLEPHDNMNSLLKRVDDALYLAKERGRNRVEMLSGGEPGTKGCATDAQGWNTDISKT